MINILTFNEFKESDDYKIQQWFIKKKLNITNWFNSESYAGLEFDYFEFESGKLYDLYAGELYFHEDTIQWQLQLLIDTEKLTEDLNVEEVKLVLKGFKSETQELIGVLERSVKDAELSEENIIIELINEFKIEYVTDENGDQHSPGDVQGLVL